MAIAHNDLRLASGAMSGGNSRVNSLYLLTYPVETNNDENGVVHGWKMLDNASVSATEGS